MVTTLPKTNLFEGLTPQQVTILRQHFHTCIGHAGDVLFRSGDPATTLYLVFKGSVSIRYKPYDGPAITLGQIGTGNVCGWSAIVGRETYTSDGVCNTETVLMCIRRETLRNFCRKHPDIGRILLHNIADLVSGRWQDAREKIDQIFASWLSSGEEENEMDGNERPEQETPPMHPVQALVEQLSAYIEQYHGGGVEFVSLDGNVLKVRLQGACVGCPLSPTTLHGWVAGTIHQFFPEIEVEAV
jgi:CRP-like cAMP-binding protein/Fe-S cluster biogenesis protein NfuA